MEHDITLIVIGYVIGKFTQMLVYILYDKWKNKRRRNSGLVL
jgi:hypothetical protein